MISTLGESAAVQLSRRRAADDRFGECRAELPRQPVQVVSAGTEEQHDLGIVQMDLLAQLQHPRTLVRGG